MTAEHAPRWSRERHVVGHLGIGADERGHGTARMYVPPDVSSPTGVPLAGALATLVDMLGGSLAAVAAVPDTVVTTDLTVVRRPGARPRWVTGVGDVVRAGRTSVTTEARLVDDAGAAVGWGAMTSARLTGGRLRHGTAALFRVPARPPVPGEERPHLLHLVGVEPADGAGGAPGCLVPLRPDLLNGVGMLHGGVVALLVDAVAVRAGRALGLDGDVVTESLELRYVAAARVGPVRAEAEVLVASHGAASARVEVHDEGNGRLTALATARAVVAPAAGEPDGAGA